MRGGGFVDFCDIIYLSIIVLGNCDIYFNAIIWLTRKEQIWYQRKWFCLVTSSSLFTFVHDHIIQAVRNTNTIRLIQSRGIMLTPWCWIDIRLHQNILVFVAFVSTVFTRLLKFFLSCLINITTADDLMTQRDGSPTSMVKTCSPFYWHGSTLIPAWISNHMLSRVWDEFTYQFLHRWSFGLD